MNKKFEEMTVKELKEESRKRGLTLESKGHKFKKSELIERLVNFEMVQKDIDDDIQKAIDEAGEEVVCVKEKEQNVKCTKERPEGYIVYAKTLDEIEKKYGNRKKQEIYDNELKVGSFVVFVHYVEAKNGEIYKKLRTAKVVGVNRKNELVRVITLLGTEKELTFDDLLYVRGCGRECSYPKDISSYLEGQRTMKGKVLINERFS